MVLRWLQDRRLEWLCDGCRTGDQNGFAMVTGPETNCFCDGCRTGDQNGSVIVTGQETRMVLRYLPDRRPE
jgi:hypothetical protein